MCFEGQCVNTAPETSSSSPWNTEEALNSPQWSPWESTGACKSACIARPRGFRKLSRSCSLANATLSSITQEEPQLKVIETRLKP